jgi:ATP-dependent DNA helicase UvrD/PcrA
MMWDELSLLPGLVRNILVFPGQFSPKAEIVTLDRNYRSTQPIRSAAKRRYRSRQGTLHQQPLDEAHFVGKASPGRRAGRGRPGALHRRLVDLTRRNIPFVKFGGLKFLDCRARQGPACSAAVCRESPRQVAGSAWCTYCRVLVLLPRSAFSITWQRPPIRSARFLPFSPRRAPATTRRTFVETIGTSATAVGPGARPPLI